MGKKGTDTSYADKWVEYSKSRGFDDAADDEHLVKKLKKYQKNPPHKMPGYDKNSESFLKSEYQSRDPKDIGFAGRQAQTNHSKTGGFISSVLAGEQHRLDKNEYGAAWADSTNADRKVREMISAAQQRKLK